MNSPSQKSAWPFVLPFFVFMIAGTFEPRFGNDQEPWTAPSEVNSRERLSETPDLQPVDSSANDEYFRQQRAKTVTRYCLTYAIKALVVCGLLIWFWRIYMEHFPLSISFWSMVVGFIGVVIWIGLCELQIETTLLNLLQRGQWAARSQFDPYAGIDDNTYRMGFLGLRFLGLVIMVPICEELFLRGFAMRYFESADWWNVSIARLGTRALLIAPAYGALTHPGEAIAAIAWFSLVTLLVCKTGKFWDAVVAHSVTNLLLGIYVCVFAQWHLW